MDKRLNKFATTADYNSFIEGTYLKPNVSYIEETDTIKWQKDAPDPSKQYLTFVALEDGTFNYTKKGTGNDLEYSIDGGTTWTSLSGGRNTPTISAGSKIMWRGELTPRADDWRITGGTAYFTSTNSFNATGNPMSILFGDNFIGQTDLTGKDFAFKLLFNGSKIVSAENLALPANTLAKRCYQSMFYGCTSLTTAPELPATTLAEGCYSDMLRGCTSLTTAPELPATTLAEVCYSDMLRGCTSLTTAPALPATTLVRGCYSSMFNGCTSLTTAPDMSVTEMVGDQTCFWMFRNCSNLNYIKMLATNISGSECLYSWVEGVSATGTFVKAAGVTLPTGVNGIPEGWTVIEE